MTYKLVYHPTVVSDDIPKLNGAWKKKIKLALEQKLTTEPDLYGKPLRRDLSGCFKLRVGDYRVIYQIKKESVFIIVIQHRSVVYKKNHEKRFKD